MLLTNMAFFSSYSTIFFSARHNPVEFAAYEVDLKYTNYISCLKNILLSLWRKSKIIHQRKIIHQKKSGVIFINPLNLHTVPPSLSLVTHILESLRTLILNNNVFVSNERDSACSHPRYPDGLKESMLHEPKEMSAVVVGWPSQQPSTHTAAHSLQPSAGWG